MFALAVSAAALLAWLGVLLLPGQPQRTRERLEPQADTADLADVTVLIPARNEADVIAGTLRALARQGPGLRVLVIDDESADGTAEVCAGLARDPAWSARDGARGFPVAIEVLRGQPLPPQWGGKLWALEQGLGRVVTRYTLLLDADIELAPGTIAALRRKARSADVQLVSVMALLNCSGFWERLLAPPFVYFFKLLYPFARVNAPGSRVAAAAGGCLLVETAVLRGVGGFAAIRTALIDDVSLAALVKARGYALWLGLSHAVVSRRAYSLAAFWRMVSRTAFTQLRYSLLLLAAVCATMLIVFVAPVLMPLLAPTPAVVVTCLLALGAMGAAYLPTVRFYGLPGAWVLTLPFAAVLFLAMTVSSALNYRRGLRARWKGRDYAVTREQQAGEDASGGAPRR